MVLETTCNQFLELSDAKLVSLVLSKMIIVKLPPHLRTLARINADLRLDITGPATMRAVIERVEAEYPMLSGTIRDHNSQQRRPYLRFFACGKDISHEPLHTALPEAVISGREPLIILGAISGG